MASRDRSNGGMKLRPPLEIMGVLSLWRDDAVNSVHAESIESLVEQAQAGDARAFEAVYHRTSARVYSVCLRMSGDADRATELLQDVFVRVWERLASFRGESLFTTWLHRLTVNLILQERRSRRRREAREVASPDLEKYGRTVRQAMPGTRIDLERAIAGLLEKARRVLVLRDVEAGHRVGGDRRKNQRGGAPGRDG